MNTKLKIAAVTAVLAAGLLAAPLLYAHESVPATRGAMPRPGHMMGGDMMGGNMMGNQAEGGMMGEMSEMMKICDSMMRDYQQFKTREPDDGHED